MSNQSQKKKPKKLFAILVILLLFVVGAFLFMKVMSDNQNSNDTESTVEEEIVTEEVVEAIEIIEEEPEIYTASILSAGDVILHSPFISSRVYHQGNGVYDYNAIFSYIKNYYESADFTVVNFESTVSESNYSGYPYFRSPVAIATALKQSNVDMCLLANNHIYDNSDSGLTMTMNALEENGLLYMGIRKSITESTYSIQEVNGIKVGFFNYVYETGAADSQKSINANVVSNASADLINTFHYNNLEAFYEEIRTGLQAMQNAGVEYTIAYLHWGNEYQTEENRYQQAIAQQLCELGIDALIGGHPHVVQPVDLLTNTTGDHQMVCVYSMGNHLSNQRIEFMDSMPTGHTEDGLMVQLTLEKIDNGPVSLVETEFIPTWVYHTTKNGGSEYFIMALDNPEQLIQNATELDLSADVDKSLNRTNAIIGSGVEKIQTALPITN